MSIPSKRRIQSAKRELRRLIDASKDPCVTRIAYGMECVLRWATEDTVGWESPSDDAIILGDMLRKELQPSPISHPKSDSSG